MKQLALDFAASASAVPPGFRRSWLPDCIEPTTGRHAGVPMRPGSALALVLEELFADRLRAVSR